MVTKRICFYIIIMGIYIYIYIHICRFLGQGLFTILDYKTWKPRRQIYDPAFNKRYIFVNIGSKCLSTYTHTHTHIHTYIHTYIIHT